MRIFRNGVLAFDETTGDLFDDGQLSQISLSMVALDAEIGQGTLAVPGNPGWVAGDRITIYEQGTTAPGGDNVTSGGVDVVSGGVQVISTPSGPAPTTSDYLIFMGYVGPHSRIRNPYAPLEFTSIYQLMDVNRQAIGRQAVDVYEANTAGPPPSLTGSELATLALSYRGDVDVDTTWQQASGTAILATVYNSDGAMDMFAQLILSTGYTVFYAPTQTDNLIEYHFHPLTIGVGAGLSIDDTPGNYDGVTVFAPRDPEYRADPADIKNEITLRNGVTTIASSNLTSQALYNAGGLRWDFNGSYGTDEQSLIAYNASLIAGAFERITYACTIGPLDGAQIAAIPPGSLINVTSQVFGLSAQTQRISRITLTPAQGQLVAPGLWDAHLELSYPFRLPAAALGWGGQGGASGMLTDPYLNADHFRPVSGGQFVASDIPVSGTYRIPFQLCDITGAALALPSVQAFFTLEQWSDVAETLVGDGWSISIPTNGDVTDTSGQVYVDLSHDTAGTSVVVNVIASL